jgi:hypothetical protein
LGSVPGGFLILAEKVVGGGPVIVSRGALRGFGHGAVEGVIAPAIASAGERTSALIPTVVFGIPGNVTTAVLLGAFIIQGLVPGRDMLTKDLSLTFTMAWTMIAANVVAIAVTYRRELGIDIETIADRGDWPGLAERVFEVLPALVARGLEVLSTCPGRSGCPSCVGPVNEVGRRAKLIATAILDRLLHHCHVLQCGPRSWRTRLHSDRNAS